ncbi:uncharacterized protein LOC127687172 isoform X2 [Apodemus sylvaticus]|uniref:uncharacterized protein LOC127687172 isoform X2 n=1 Tax=Apodemus sylvaticus TaxID=10129 RepID=UPI002244151E|nr:uncharacterized protein LOC127687172 isoform X2 [Apodemus sylvaticus]
MIAPALLRALRKNKTLRYGVPMLLLVVGGSFGLREFSQIRYDAVTVKHLYYRRSTEYTRTSVSQAWKQRSRKLYSPAFSHVGMPGQRLTLNWRKN